METDLKILRKKLGLTQKQVASRVGLSIGYYSLIENEKVMGCASARRQIAAVLGLYRSQRESKEDEKGD